MVGRVGADPTALKATVLQTAEFADSLYLLILVGEEGLEPSMFLMSRFYGPLPSPLGDSPELTNKKYRLTRKPDGIC